MTPNAQNERAQQTYSSRRGRRITGHVPIAKAADLLPYIPEQWTGVRQICIAAGLVYGGGDPNHNLAYKALNELHITGLIEKRQKSGGHSRYTEYRQKPPPGAQHGTP